MTALRLSYAEIGERLGRTPEAARILVRRRGWQRVEGNDGRVVVLLDDAELKTARPLAKNRMTGGQPRQRQQCPGGQTEQTFEDSSAAVTTPVISPVDPDGSDYLAELLGRVRGLEERLEERDAELVHHAVAAARAEGEAAALRDALADLAGRLDGEARRRQPWWRRMFES